MVAKAKPNELGKKEEKAEPKAKIPAIVTMKNTFSEGKKEGFTEGHSDGLAKGKKEGYTKGHSDGLAKGREDGTKAGHQSGRKEGYEDGLKKGKDTGLKIGNKEGFLAGKNWAWPLAMAEGRLEGKKKIVISIETAMAGVAGFQDWDKWAQEGLIPAWWISVLISNWEPDIREPESKQEELVQEEG